MGEHLLPVAVAVYIVGCTIIGWHAYIHEHIIIKETHRNTHTHIHTHTDTHTYTHTHTHINPKANTINSDTLYVSYHFHSVRRIEFYTLLESIKSSAGTNTIITPIHEENRLEKLVFVIFHAFFPGLNQTKQKSSTKYVE